MPYAVCQVCICVFSFIRRFFFFFYFLALLSSVVFHFASTQPRNIFCRLYVFQNQCSREIESNFSLSCFQQKTKNQNGKKWKFPFICISLLEHVQCSTWKCGRLTFIIMKVEFRLILNSDWDVRVLKVR